MRWDRWLGWLICPAGLRGMQPMKCSSLEKFLVGLVRCIIARDVLFSMLLETAVAAQGCHAGSGHDDG